MEEKEIKEQAFEFAKKLNIIVGYYGLTSSAIHLMFMKYLCNFDNVKTPEEFKSLMSYKNMFLNKTFSKDIVIDTFKIVNDFYKIENNLLIKTVEYLEDIFKDKNRNDNIFNLLNEFELPRNSKDMCSFINYILDYNDRDISRSTGFTTNASLSNLVTRILDVKDNEIYLDCFTGFNRTALNVNASKYLGCEINLNTSVVSNMIMILTDKKNFSIKNEDFYLTNNKNIADKIFADGPICLKLNDKEKENLGNECRFSDYYNIKKSLECLKENGLALITVTSKVLSNELFKKIREDFTISKLKSVIALPSLWSGTSLNTNLLVFENNKTDNKITMIDASSNQCINKNNIRNHQLNEESIEKIIKSLNGEIIEEFSNVISTREILNRDDFSWQPQLYIKRKLDVDYRPSSEIKKDLNLSYKELLNLLLKDKNN